MSRSGRCLPILRKTTGLGREQCLADFGDAFHRYCGKLLRGMYPASSVLVDRIECPVTGIARDGNSVEIADACLIDLTEVVLFELKSAWLPDEIAEADDPVPYLNAVEDRYARARGPKGPKGAGQLASSNCALGGRRLEGEKCRTSNAPRRSTRFCCATTGTLRPRSIRGSSQSSSARLFPRMTYSQRRYA